MNFNPFDAFFLLPAMIVLQHLGHGLRLRRQTAHYGDNFKIECPTGSGNLMNPFEVARELASRLTRIFLRDESRRRPVYGGTEKFQTDPHWKDYILFFEYFHGDNGAGLGATHQTGWTGVVAKLIEMFGRLDGRQVLEAGRAGAFAIREEIKELV